MNYTDYLKLNLPTATTVVDIGDLNENAIKIDEELKRLKTELENAGSDEEIQQIQKEIEGLITGLQNLEDAKADKDKVVSSVNNKIGDVELTGDDLYVSDSWKAPIGSIVMDNFNNKADKKELSRSSTIVIANYDSHANSKKAADITIEEGENAATKISEAIQSLEGIGGEVKLMEGNYNLEYGIAVNVDGVHLTGIPKATVLVQNSNWKGNPYVNDRKSIIDMWRESDREGVDVEITNIHVKGAKVEGSPGFSCYGSSKVTNCISENSGSDGFYCDDSSKIVNCTSEDNSSNGFSCRGSSETINCISENSGNDGFYCFGSSEVIDCISRSSGRNGFYCSSSSRIANCVSENSGNDGFSCSDSSSTTNCMSENSSNKGFSCDDSSKVINCMSENSGNDGFYCTTFFKGVCGHNTLVGDKLGDASKSPAVVQYNIIQEGV